jgi:hypothetical protein
VTSGFLVTTQSAANAVAKLTPAQHRAVLAGRIDTLRGYWPLWNALNRKKLFTRANGSDVLTEFGRAVQRELMEQDRERAR